MKNGWRKLLVFSLILILFEAIGAVLVMLPFYSRQMVFSNIEKGNSVKVRAYYDMLGDEGREKVQSYLDDFAATICKKYIEGVITYEEAVASLDAIDEIDSTKVIVDSYMPNVAANEFKLVMNDLCKANIIYDTGAIYNLSDKMDKISQRLNNDVREKLMIELVNDKYREYLNEDISAEELSAMCSLVADNSFYQAHDYAETILSNANSVLAYRNIYIDCQTMLEENDYFEILDICKQVTVDNWDEKYKDLFETLYITAYEGGKEYYPKELERLVSSNDKPKAVELMNQIEEYYGSEIDISSVADNMLTDWQKEYIDYMESFDASMNAHTVNTVLLYDINDDDIPEMFLFDIADINNSFIGCEVYNIKNNKCRHLGYYKVINLCDDGYLITLPTSGGSDEAYALTYYDGETLTEGEVCKKSGETYYINGEEVSDADYLSVRTGILAHASAYTINNSKNADISEALEYIMLFENK